MDDNAQPNEDKKVTKAVTDEPQEEFIQPEARPSRPEESTPNEKQN